MADYAELLNTIKQAATEAVDAEKPVQVCFGKVTSASPLQILVDQKMTLDSSFLVKTRNVTDFTTMVTVQWESGASLTTHSHTVKGKDSNSDDLDLISSETKLNHTHNIAGTKQIIIRNKLQMGEDVILLRMQGGQKYIVLDRVGGE